MMEFEENLSERLKEAMTADPVERKKIHFDLRKREDALSAITLAKTIAFLLYSMLVPLITLAAIVVLPIRSFTRETQFLFAGVLFVILEWLLYVGVIHGVLPSPQPENVNPFNEHQMGLGVAFLSLTPWLMRLDLQSFQAFQAVVNGSLCIGVLVFFLTKSMISRRFRWGVLWVILIPLLQLYTVFR